MTPAQKTEAEKQIKLLRAQAAGLRKKGRSVEGNRKDTEANNIEAELKAAG